MNCQLKIIQNSLQFSLVQNYCRVKLNIYVHKLFILKKSGWRGTFIYFVCSEIINIIICVLPKFEKIILGSYQILFNLEPNLLGKVLAKSGRINYFRINYKFLYWFSIKLVKVYVFAIEMNLNSKIL